MSTAIIRRAGLDDALSLAELAERTFRDTFAAANRPEDFAQYVVTAFGPAIQRAEIADVATDTFLLEHEGQLAGYAQVRAGSRPPEVGDDTALELRRFYLDRAWHGRGLAAQLMQSTVAAAAARGATGLWLGVWERNQRAMAFYRKSGFLDVGSQLFMLGADPQRDRVMLMPFPRDHGPVRAPDRVFTERLLLERPRASDAETLFSRFAADPAVTRYVSWPRHTSLDDTRSFLAFSDDEWARWPAGPYLIRSRETGELLGSSGLGFEAADRASTGYVLARDAWGRGYATETLRTVIDVARAVGVQRLYALCHTDHTASAHVLEKAGLVREAMLPRHTEFPNLDPGVVANVFRYARQLVPTLPRRAG